jgi:hypothetical protein
MIDRVLKPYPLASSSFAFIRAFFRQSTSEVVKLFGFSENNDISPSNPDPDIAKTLKHLEAKARQIPDGGASTNPSSSGTDPETSSPSQKSDLSDSTSTRSPTNVKDLRQSGQRQAKQSIPGYEDLSNKSQGPWAAFVQQWRRSWRPLRYFPPRGCVAIHGMVALESPKGRIYIDVTAWYNPIKKEFHQESIQLGLKAISPAHQSPRR